METLFLYGSHREFNPNDDFEDGVEFGDSDGDGLGGGVDQRFGDGDGFGTGLYGNGVGHGRLYGNVGGSGWKDGYSNDHHGNTTP